MKKLYIKPEMEVIDNYKDKDSFIMGTSLFENNLFHNLDGKFSLTDDIFDTFWKK